MVSNGCLKGGTTSPMKVSDGVPLSAGLLGLEKKVAKESFGSWMVVEKCRGQGRVTGDSKNVGKGGSPVGSRFSILFGMTRATDSEIGGDLGERRKQSDSNGIVQDKVGNLGLRNVDKRKGILLDNTKSIKKKGALVLVGPKQPLRY